MRHSNTTPTDDELKGAVDALQLADRELGPRRVAFDCVVLMLQDELDRRDRGRKLLAIMERVGDHCTIAQARAILESGEHV